MTLQDLNHFRRIRRCKSFKAEVDTLYPKVRDYIGAEKDAIVRKALELRFLKGYSWIGISIELGGYQHEHAIKKMCYRAIHKRSKEE